MEVPPPSETAWDLTFKEGQQSNDPPSTPLELVAPSSFVADANPSLGEPFNLGPGGFTPASHQWLDANGDLVFPFDLNAPQARDPSSVNGLTLESAREFPWTASQPDHGQDSNVFWRSGVSGINETLAGPCSMDPPASPAPRLAVPEQASTAELVTSNALWTDVWSSLDIQGGAVQQATAARAVAANATASSGLHRRQSDADAMTIQGGIAPSALGAHQYGAVAKKGKGVVPRPRSRSAEDSNSFDEVIKKYGWISNFPRNKDADEDVTDASGAVMAMEAASTVVTGPSLSLQSSPEQILTGPTSPCPSLHSSHSITPQESTSSSPVSTFSPVRSRAVPAAAATIAAEGVRTTYTGNLIKAQQDQAVGNNGRIPNACIQCKNRKARCDGKATCSRCVRFGLDCRYLEENRKRGKGKNPKKKASSSDSSDWQPKRKVAGGSKVAGSSTSTTSAATSMTASPVGAVGIAVPSRASVPERVPAAQLPAVEPSNGLDPRTTTAYTLQFGLTLPIGTGF